MRGIDCSVQVAHAWLSPSPPHAGPGAPSTPPGCRCCTAWHAALAMPIALLQIQLTFARVTPGRIPGERSRAASPALLKRGPCAARSAAAGGTTPARCRAPLPNPDCRQSARARCNRDTGAGKPPNPFYHVAGSEALTAGGLGPEPICEQFFCDLVAVRCLALGSTCGATAAALPGPLPMLPAR